jgi:hypothetical protein
MSQISASETLDAQHTDIQITLTWPEAARLRTVLPWLLRALEDRPTTSPRHRERRQTAHVALERLLNTLSSQLEQAEADRSKP